MRPLYWPFSQIILSANSFLLQVAALKESEVTFAANFSILLTLQMLFFLLMRKLYSENFALSEIGSKRPPIIELTLCFAVISFLLTVMNGWSYYLLINFSVYTLVLFCLDIGRFRSQAQFWNVHQVANIIILLSTISSFILQTNLKITIGMINILLLSYIVLFTRKSFTEIFNLRRNAYYDRYRGFDFLFSSGFNYLLPILVYYELNSYSVLDLRSAQAFMSLINFYTVSLFIHQLNTSKEINFFVFIFSPSLILAITNIMMLVVFNGKLPFFHDSLSRIPTLNWLLILSLFIVQISSYTTIKGIKLNCQREILAWHLKIIVPNFITYWIALNAFGLLGFGYATIVSNSFDAFGLSRIATKKGAKNEKH